MVAAATFAVLAFAFFEVSPALASTICVPAFSAACPDSGGNFEMASLDAAIKQNGADGISDKVIVAAGTPDQPGCFRYRRYRRARDHRSGSWPDPDYNQRQRGPRGPEYRHRVP
ncbi:MAG: hypothetical protein IPK93_03770 [Solirubrobacterales bacterium]|nr:hypothetical protein [Solirubrobacterales bacterium]